MPRKVFISVLGTGHYKPAKYYFNNNQEDYLETRFIQQASIAKICQDWNENDKILIFLTKLAREVNWEKEAQKNHRDGTYPGLSYELKKLNPKATIEDWPISDGNSEEEIWKIFETVFSKLENDDEVYFDITHAFRSLPMLLMVLIHYAKFLKNIKVASITYGNWEVGKENQGLSPILDLTSFSVLQDWSGAAQEFIRFGRMSMTEEVITDPLKDLAKQYKGQSEEVLNLRQLIKNLQATPDSIYTCRGKKIFEGLDAQNYKDLREKNVGSFFPPLIPLLQTMDEKVQEFSPEQKLKNGFEAVKWCINYNWIQQGYTILQETLISFILKNLGKNWENEILRNTLNACAGIIVRKEPEEEWKGVALKHKDIARELSQNEIVIKFSKINYQLTDFRNDMNHAGIRKNPKPFSTLKDNLPVLYKEIVKLVHEVENV